MTDSRRVLKVLLQIIMAHLTIIRFALIRATFDAYRKAIYTQESCFVRIKLNLALDRIKLAAYLLIYIMHAKLKIQGQ